MNYLTGAVMMALQLIPCCYIILTTFRENIHKPKRQSAVIVGCALLLLAFISVASSYAYTYFPFSPLITSVISMFFISFILYHLSDLMFAQCLYIVMLLTNLIECAQLIIRVTYHRDGPPNPPDWVYLGRLSLVLFVVFPFAHFMFKHYYRPLFAKTRNLNIWNYLCLIPGALFFIYRFNIYPDYFDQPIHWHSGFYLLPAFWTFVVLLVHFATLRTPKYLLEKLILEEQLHYTELLTDSQRKQYESMRASIRTEKRLRHDFRHSLLAIQAYAKQNDCDSILDYIDTYLEPLGRTLEPVFCKNTFINTFLDYYISQAKELGIQVTYDIRIPEQIHLPEADLCIVLGNLLENALEACRRQESDPRFMKIHMEMTSKRIFSLSISNSFHGEIVKKDSRYMSSKRNDYGIGLVSVHHIVEKHNGMMKINHKDSIFTVSVLIHTRNS